MGASSIAKACAVMTVGYPRIGPKREMKKALEDFWASKIDADHLRNSFMDVMRSVVRDQVKAGVDLIGVGDQSMYDHVLDWAFRFGIFPRRFSTLCGNAQEKAKSSSGGPNGSTTTKTTKTAFSKERLNLYFALARGRDGVTALDMTKWFDTNYHNLTPEIDESDDGDDDGEGIPTLGSAADKSDWSDYLELLEEAKKEVPADRLSAIVLGPLTLFHSSKLPKDFSFDKFQSKIWPFYQKLFRDISAVGLREVQLHEPALVVEKYHTSQIEAVYTKMTSSLSSSSSSSISNNEDDKAATAGSISCSNSNISCSNSNITNTSSSSGQQELPAVQLVTFFDDLGKAYEWVVKLPGIAGVSLDFTRGENLKAVQQFGFPSDRRLGCGVFDGRSVWKDDEFAKNVLTCLFKMLSHLRTSSPPEIFGQPPLLLQPSCSLLHVPLDLNTEDSLLSRLPADVASRLRFARQKLEDMKTLCNDLPDLMTTTTTASLKEAETGGKAATNNTSSSYVLPCPLPMSPDGGYLVGVEDKDAEPTAEMITRSLSYEKRRSLQLPELQKLYFPTSTVGSFPQTVAMRKVRLACKNGEVDRESYLKAVDHYINYCIGVQEGIGLDVLVHGEPERSDMVEYFAEHMEGFLVTSNGWVQSYGSRYVRPPIVCGEVKRAGGKAITVREFIVAQKCTQKAVKGILTGPVTILNWSFPRKDISRKSQAFQIGAALRSEVADLDVAGCRCLQMDEPALREGLPLRAERRAEYLRWAVKAFRLATAVAMPTTHVVTHFCYSEFGEIMESIKQMDADQVTIENSRSDDAMLKEMEDCGFSHDLAPGVYDVHSPVVPSEESVAKRLLCYAASSKLKTEKFWVVPDCGLKTRKWEEVIPSLRNLVQATRRVRKTLEEQSNNGV